MTHPLNVWFSLKPGESREVTVELCVSTVGDYWEHWTEHWTNRTTVSCDDDGPYVAHSRSFMEQVTAADSRKRKRHNREGEALSRAWKGGFHR